MGSHQPIRKVVTPEIPDKLYFRIGDVAQLCEVPPYVLRFWETEFPQLKPNKGGTGQRLYRKRDVEMALRIKGLLYDQGYTIPGARQVFKAEARPKEVPSLVPEPATLQTVSQPQAVETAPRSMSQMSQLVALREEMRSLLAMLGAPASGEDKVKTMRPRLVLEPRPESRPVPAERPRLLLEQRGLFGDAPSDFPGPADLSE